MGEDRGEGDLLYVKTRLRLRRAFFAIKSQRLHDRPVIHGEKNRRVMRSVAVMMPAPERNRKRVAGLPVVARVVDHGESFASENMVNRAAGMAMRLRLLSGTQHLKLAGNGRQGRAAVGRVHKPK